MALSPQTSVIHPRDTAVRVGTSGPPPKVSPIKCGPCTVHGRCREGPAAWQWTAAGNLWIEWGVNPGRHGMEWADLTRPIQIQNWPCRGRIKPRQDDASLQTALEKGQQRRNGNCPSSPRSHATQLSLSLYLSHTSQAADPPLVPSVSACE